jgi:hypothetical protein
LPVATLDEVAGCLARPGPKPLSAARAQTAIRVRLKLRNAP